MEVISLLVHLHIRRGKALGMVKRTILPAFCFMMLAPPLGAVPDRHTDGAGQSDTGRMYCQELMDLEIPSDDAEQGMDLPPLTTGQESVPQAGKTLPLKSVPRAPEQEMKSEVSSTEASPARQPLRAEGAEAKEMEEPVPASPMPLKSYSGVDLPSSGTRTEEAGAIQSTPGLSPRILPQPKEAPEVATLPSEPAEVSGKTVSPELTQPGQLKTIQPPPAKALSLKVPSEATGGVLTGPSTPEIPLLAGKKTPGAGSTSAEPVPPLALKTEESRVESLEAKGAPGAGDQSPPVGRYTGRWEDLDQKLIDLYDRFYK